MTVRADDEREPLRIFLAALPRVIAALEQQLAVCPTPIDVAWTLCDFAGRALDLTDCVIYLVDGDGHSVSQYAAWGPKRIAERIFENRIRLAFGQGIVGAAAATGAPQVVPDTRLDRRHVRDEGGGLSELAVPILHGERVLGVIDTEHPHADRYHSGHIRALLAVAERGAARLMQL